VQFSSDDVAPSTGYAVVPLTGCARPPSRIVCHIRGALRTRRRVPTADVSTARLFLPLCRRVEHVGNVPQGCSDVEDLLIGQRDGHGLLPLLRLPRELRRAGRIVQCPEAVSPYGWFGGLGSSKWSRLLATMIVNQMYRAGMPSITPYQNRTTSPESRSPIPKP
jgi:hypothetical protein